MSRARRALLTLCLVAAALGAAGPAGAFNACAGTSDGALALCAAADWQDPAACFRLDLALPDASGGTGSCLGA